MKKKKEITLITTFLLIIALIGITYALLRFQLTGERTQVLRIGDLELKLEETGNTLGLESGEPLSDEEGLSLQGFDFTLKNDSTKTVDYTIYLDDVELDNPSDVRINDKNVKYSLDKNGVKGDAKPLTDTGVNPERVLEEGSIGKNQQNDYTLRIWVINSQEDITDQVFKAKIRVENTLKPNDINVDNNNIVLDLSKKKQEQISINKEELGEVSYQSKDSSIAEVSPDGLITAVGIGSTEIDVLSGSYKQTIRVKVEKTVEAVYVKQGLGVQEIEKEKDSCVLKTKGEVCEKTLPTITMKSDEYTAVGWNTLKDSEEGQNGKITFQDNVTYYAISYKNEIPYKVLFNGNGNVIDAEEKSCSLPKAYNDTPQPTSCTVITPTISVNDKTPIVVGYNQEKTATTAEVGSNQELKVDASNNGKTYYAITKSEEQEYSVKFDGNNNQIDAEEKSCSIEEAYNGESQKTSCTIITPTISVNPNTPTIIGFSQNQQATEKEVDHKSELEVNENNNGKTYYAITRKDAVNREVNYSKQGIGVTAIGKESDSCEIPAVYNGAIQETSCMVDAPDITVLEGYTKVGWSENKDDTAGIAVGAKITLSKDAAPTYYSISYKNAITYQVSFDGNGNVIDATEKTCVLPVAYNTTEQQTSCDIETPTISINPNTPTIIGYSTTSDDHTKTVGSKETLTVNESNNGTTYYAQTTKEKVDYNVKFDANNNVIDDTEKACSLAATFNGEEQATTCTVMTPTITAPANTKVIVGYHQDKTSHIAEVGSNQELVVGAENNNKTYYAITKSEAIIRNVNYSMQGLGVTAIGKEKDSCTIDETYNNEKQEEACIVQTPDITVLEGYTKVGWNENKEETTGVAVGANITLSTEDAPTYYSISYKNEVTYQVNFNENGNTIDATEKTCTIEKSYNTTPQATSCDITTPTITANPNTPDIIGYNQEKDTHTSEVGSNQELIVSATNHNKTYYAQTTAPAKTHTITFNKNGAQSQTDESDIAQVAETVTRSCIRDATFNGVEQEATCSVTSPTIVGTGITPTVTGYSDAAGNHTNGWSHNSPKEISGDATWYAQTTRGEVIRSITFYRNNNTSFTYGTDKVIADSKKYTLCSIAAIYNNNNGKEQDKSCSAKITMPSIEAPSYTQTIRGWTTGATTYTNPLAVESSQTLSASEDLSYYAQTYKGAVTRSITFYRNNNTSFTYGTDKVTADSKKYTLCTIDEVRNNNGGKEQDKSCSATITFPTIEAPANTQTLIGWSDSATNRTQSYTSGQANVVLTATGDYNFYAQTKKDAVTKSVSYQKTTGVASIGKESDKCIIPAIYNNNNGKAQDTSCTVQLPTINVSSGYELIGWNTSSSATTGTKPGTTITLADSSITYYALAKVVIPSGGNAVTTLLNYVTNSESLQDYQASTEAQKKNMYVFNHTAGTQQSGWSSSELKDYRYIGTAPNNYVTFNNEVAGWRIIGIETVDNGSGKREKRIKIVNSLMNYKMSWDNKPSGTGSSESMFGSNDWTDSRAMMVLNPGYDNNSLASNGKGSIYWNRQRGNCPSGYNNGSSSCDFTSNGLTSEAKALIGEAKWYLGGTSTYSKISSGTADQWYSYERGEETCRTAGKCTNTRKTSWTGYVGLIYPSDYRYATSGGDTVNWLGGWTITARTNSGYHAFNTGDYNGTYDSHNVHPVVYLKANVLYQSGDGSQSNPFEFKSSTSSDQGIEGPSSINITSKKEIVTTSKQVCQEEVSTGSNYNFTVDSNVEVKTGSVCTTSNNNAVCTNYNNDIDTTSNKSCMSGNHVITYTKNSDSCGYIYVCDNNNKCSAKREC